MMCLNAEKKRLTPRRKGRKGRKEEQTFEPRSLRLGVRFFFLFLLAGCLIYCHGCHGPDVDDELSLPWPVAQDNQR
jgi:hypothetical protein